MSKLPTSRENIALDIAFDLLGESRVNRTQEDYMSIAARLPPIKKLHGMINDRLAEMKKTSTAGFPITHFKSGDLVVRYEEFPSSVSLETVRSALTKIGMREAKYRRRK